MPQQSDPDRARASVARCLWASHLRLVVKTWALLARRCQTVLTRSRSLMRKWPLAAGASRPLPSQPCLFVRLQINLRSTLSSRWRGRVSSDQLQRVMAWKMGRTTSSPLWLTGRAAGSLLLFAAADPVLMSTVTVSLHRHKQGNLDSTNIVVPLGQTTHLSGCVALLPLKTLLMFSVILAGFGSDASVKISCDRQPEQRGAASVTPQGSDR